MPLMLGEAAKVVGKNRTTILRAIKTGKLSAAHDDASGAWLIEPAELHRLYPQADARASAPKGDAHLRTGHASGEIRELRARLDAAEARLTDAHDQIADLRHQRDAEAEERRTAQAKLTALLTDRRPPDHPSPDVRGDRGRRRWWWRGNP